MVVREAVANAKAEDVFAVIEVALRGRTRRWFGSGGFDEGNKFPSLHVAGIAGIGAIDIPGRGVVLSRACH